MGRIKNAPEWNRFHQTEPEASERETGCKPIENERSRRLAHPGVAHWPLMGLAAGRAVRPYRLRTDPQQRNDLGRDADIDLLSGLRASEQELFHEQCAPLVLLDQVRKGRFVP